MNLRFWERTTDEDDEEQDATPAPVPAVVSKADQRAARLVSTPKRSVGDWNEMELPESGERFERWLIKTMHQLGPISITILIGASVGYFMADFSTTLTLPTFIGYAGGILVALVECALVFKARLASKAGDDEQAIWLRVASFGFGFASIITQIVFLQTFLSNHLADASALDGIPLLGAFVGLMGGSTFFVIVRACIYHGALYASAWLLSGSKPSLIKQIEWQERVMLHQRSARRFMSEVEQPLPALTAASPGREPMKDILAMMQQLQQQVTEMQTRQNSTTGQYRAVEPESEVSRNGHSTFHAQA